MLSLEPITERQLADQVREQAAEEKSLRPERYGPAPSAGTGQRQPSDLSAIRAPQLCGHNLDLNRKSATDPPGQCVEWIPRIIARSLPEFASIGCSLSSADRRSGIAAGCAAGAAEG